jgi:hypothetical protein
MQHVLSAIVSAVTCAMLALPGWVVAQPAPAIGQLT